MLKILATVGIMLTMAACATNSGVIEMGPDSYFLSRESGAASMGGGLKATAISEANQYCKNKGKNLQIMSSQDFGPGFAQFPRTELQFMCLNSDDPRLKGGALMPAYPVQTIKVDKTN